MRRWLGIVLIAGCGRIAFDARSGITDGGGSGDGALPVFACTPVPALAAAAVIDGVLDNGLATLPMQPVGWQSVQMPLPAMPTVSVRAAVAWRPDGLYFFIDVADPDRFPATQASYCGDGAEVYVDADGLYPNAPSFDATGVRQFIARAPATDTTPRMIGDTWLARTFLGGWTGNFGTFPRPGSYVLEAFIDANAMALGSWTLSQGMQIGFDIAVSLSTADGSFVPLAECTQSTRLGQFFFRIDESATVPLESTPFWTPTAFCTTTLQ